MFDPKLRPILRSFPLLFAVGMGGCSSRACGKEVASDQTATAGSEVAAAPTASVSPTRKRSRAVEHLPSNCLAVIRLQWARLAEHPALGPHLTAAFDPSGSVASQAGPEQRAFLNFLEHAQIDPKKDVDQVMVCLLQARPNSTVAVIGGELPGDFLSLMKRHAPNGQQFELREREGMTFLELQDQFLVQAKDNAVLVGNHFGAMREAYAAGEAHGNYGIPETGEVAAVLRGELLAEALAQPLGGTPLSSTVPKIQRLEASVDLGAARISLRATMENAARAKELDEQLQQLVREIVEEARRAPPTVRMLMASNVQLAQSAQIESDGARVSVEVPLPDGMLEGLAAQLLGPSKPPPPPPLKVEPLPSP